MILLQCICEHREIRQPDIAKDGRTVFRLGRIPKSGDRIGFKIDMSLNKIWLHFNKEFITLLWENIPDFIIPAISNGSAFKFAGTYQIKGIRDELTF